MKKQTSEPSLRDKEVAYRVSEAKRKNLHPAAIEMARRQINIPMPVVELYSQHEHALDLTQDDVLRDKALRNVFQNVIYYARYGTLPSTHQPIVPDYAASETSLQGGTSVAA